MRALHTLTIAALFWGFCLISPSELWALEKYGRPLPEMEGAHDNSEEHWVRGYLLSGAFMSNPSFAARPDNSGLVGLRHMIHLETDLYKEYLQFYTDQNFFSDRQAGWVSLSEWDSVYAFTGTAQNWGWRLQYERDAPLDRSGIIQAYADTLVTYRSADARSLSWWRSAFPEQNLTVYAGGGWFFHNQSYFARPDNSGRALFRYVAHADLDLYRNRVVLFVDGNLFTDRSASNALRPSEFDLVMGLAVRYHEMEIALIHERDLPLDRGGLVQRYVALQLRYEFEWTKSSSPAGKQLSLHR